MTDSINDVLHKLQKTLKVPKNQVNKFGGYNFRSCEDIVEAVKKELPSGYTLTLSDQIIAIGQYAYIEATATLSNGKDKLVTTGAARDAIEKKGFDPSQNTGAASSYARKYALNGMFCIDDTKDADATNDHGKSEKKEEPKAMNGEEFVMLQKDIKACRDLSDVKALKSKLGQAKPRMTSEQIKVLGKEVKTIEDFITGSAAI